MRRRRTNQLMNKSTLTDQINSRTNLFLSPPPPCFSSDGVLSFLSFKYFTYEITILKKLQAEEKLCILVNTLNWQHFSKWDHFCCKIIKIGIYCECKLGILHSSFSMVYWVDDLGKYCKTKLKRINDCSQTLVWAIKSS